MCVCQICNQSLTNVKVYIQIYIDIFIHVSLGDHNEYLLCQEVEIWSAMYPDLNLHFCARVAPGSCPGMGLGSKGRCICVLWTHVYFLLFYVFIVSRENVSGFYNIVLHVRI